MEIIEEVVFADGEELDLSQLHSIIRKIYARTRSKFGILEEYIEDESINEIMINGKDHFFLETGGDMDRAAETFDSTDELEEIIRNIAAGVHREINEMHPILDASRPAAAESTRSIRMWRQGVLLSPSENLPESGLPWRRW